MKVGFWLFSIGKGDIMKKFAWIVLIGFILVLAAGCVVSRPAFAPPPLKREIRPLSPGHNYVWIQGHWKWNGNRYTWISGPYVKKRPGMNWVSGHWVKRGRHWVWIKGHWR